MAENCKNCNEAITGNFCANCGQKKYKIIDKKYVLDEIQYTFLHANKGLLYSVKNILKNPGNTAKEFIDGNRVNHYKPILLTFVLSGIAAFLSYKVLGLKEIMSAYYADKHIESKFMGDFLSVITSYNSMITMLLLPFFAFTTKIAFRKWGHNYYEHIVMNAYILSYYTIISIFFIYPIMFFYRHSSPSTFFNITQVSVLLVPIILVWFFKGFYTDRPLKTIILKSLVVVGLTFLGFLFSIILMGIVLAVYAMLNEPDALNYMKPK